jgi:flagellar hook-associated protein 3 FlgL
MRISSSWGQQTAISSILNQESQLQQTQTEVSTGIKTLRPTDGPSATVSINNLTQSISQTQQYQTNNDAATQAVSMENASLQNASGILNQMNALCISGMNGNNNASDKASIAAQIQSLNLQLVSVANTQNVNGEYIFSGTKSTTPPFTQDANNPGAYNYSGNSAQRTIQIGPNTSVANSDPGNTVFGAPTGPAPATIPAAGSVTNIFEAINQFVTTLTTNPVKGSAQTALGASNAFTINGVTIPAMATPASQLAATPPIADVVTQGTSVAAAINALTGSTGVTAISDPKTGAITLANTTGAPIAVAGDITNTGLNVATTTSSSTLQASLSDISKGANQILSINAVVGGRLNTLTTQSTINSGSILNMKTALSSVQNVDEASAISSLNLQSVALQASQQAYSQVNKLSLFNYIS